MAESTNSSSQGNNPLSKKLNKILDNRFDSDKVSILNPMISSLLRSSNVNNKVTGQLADKPTRRQIK